MVTTGVSSNFCASWPRQIVAAKYRSLGSHGLQELVLSMILSGRGTAVVPQAIHETTYLTPGSEGKLESKLNGPGAAELVERIEPARPRRASIETLP